MKTEKKFATAGFSDSTAAKLVIARENKYLTSKVDDKKKLFFKLENKTKKFKQNIEDKVKFSLNKTSERISQRYKAGSTL